MARKKPLFPSTCVPKFSGKLIFVVLLAFGECVTFLCPYKKVTKENVLGRR